jgi:flagellar hook-associated protein 2
MTASGLFSIGGIASGLDTASIVQQLLQLERQPLQVIERRQQEHRRADEAWGQIVTRLSTLRTATNKLTDPAWLQKTTAATSSNDAVARAATSGGATPGSLSFTVDQLATRHQVAVGGTYASAEATVGAGELTLTRSDGQTSNVTLGAGATLQDAARALNDLAGTSAQVLKVADGAYRLLVTASETGANAAFTATSTVGGIADGANEVLAAGQNATLSLGGLTLSRSSNTVTDLMEGVSLQLTGTGAVTVDVAQDLDEGVTQVKGFVDGLNGLLNQIGTATKSSAEQGSRGPLNGDPLARDLAVRLRGALSQITAGDGEFRTLSQIGVSLTRDGRVTLDEDKLRNALSTDPQAVASLLGKASSADDPRVQVSSAGQSQPGTYQVQIDMAARIAAVTGAAYTPPTGAPQTFSITTGGQTVSVTIQDGDSLEAAVGRINAALLDANVTSVLATESAGSIHLQADRAGTNRDFTVLDSGTFGLDGTHEGASAQGTISDGTGTWAMTGSGQSLTVADGPAKGLILRIPTEVTGALGSVAIGDGLGSVMDRLLKTAEGADGSIARARDAVQSRIDAGKASLERFEQRLEIRERSIRRQFTALESAMAQFNAQGNWLASQLGSMQS